MTKLSKTIYLTIHGHFYQPPRENPWTGKIELQPDAHPFHDWNDKIAVQCYQPNAMSRIVDAEGKVLEMVNNFRLLSFNVGPTLLSWLETHFPIVYHRVIEGDRLSQRERSGHGNALAQVYNHMILPLAHEREQRTQIRWGVFEFKKRFGRDPEGIWLPETAASERTLEILIEEGIKFTILGPEQAQKTRLIEPSHSAAWHDVSNGSIDPTRPYRFFHSKDSKRWLDLFFFDGPLSRDVSFGDLLFDSQKFLERLTAAHRSDRHHPEMIHLACDGETFGHHKAFGERAVTFLLQEEAERHGLKRINYGEYLEKFPPQWEVKIKPGEGTSWSCLHGVGRWKEDCGCHTGGGPGWNQKWRGPLREAVRHLEECLAKLYEEKSAALFKDPWAARDHYLELILDPSLAVRERFFEKHSPRALSEKEKLAALKLLEMERFAMLTETSCGWFFNDLSGTETVQILRYALRAVEVAAEFGAAEAEKEFVEKLSRAQSNRPEYGTGRGVWEKLVKPDRVTPEKLAGHYAFLKLFELEVPREDFYGYRIEEREAEQETAGGTVLLMGAIRLTGKTLPESRDFLYAILQEGTSRVQAFIKRTASPEELHQLNVAPLNYLRKKNEPALLESLKRSFPDESVSLHDLFPEDRQKILRTLSREMRENLLRMGLRFYDENRPGISLFSHARSPLSEEFRGLVEWVMGERLFELVEKAGPKGSFEKISAQAKALFEEARAGGFSVRTQPTIEFLSRLLNAWIEKLFQETDLALVQKIESVLEFAKSLEIKLYDRIAQDLFFVFAQKVLRERIEAYRREAPEGGRLETIEAIIRLGRQLGFNMKQYENQLKPPIEVR